MHNCICMCIITSRQALRHIPVVHGALDVHHVLYYITLPAGLTLPYNDCIAHYSLSHASIYLPVT